MSAPLTLVDIKGNTHVFPGDDMTSLRQKAAEFQVPSTAEFRAMRDYTDTYFSDDASAPDDINLEIISGLPPVGDVNLHDAVIGMHLFGKDQFNRYWLIKQPGKNFTPRYPERFSALYNFAKNLGVKISEQQVINIGDETYTVSRYLPNAPDQSFREQIFSDDTPESGEIRKQISRLFAFNFLVDLSTDNQYVFTPNGNVVAIDYTLGNVVSDTEGSTRPIDIPPSPRDMDYYADHIYSFHPVGVHNFDPVELENMCAKIRNLSDNELHELVSPLPEKSDDPFHRRDLNFDGLKWRRDHIEAVFFDLFQQYPETRIDL